VADSCDVPGADHVVERAAAADVAGIADALAAAFSDYAWTRWIVDARDHTARLRRLQELTAGRVGVPFGEVWVARCPAAGGSVGDARAVVGAVVGLRPDRPVPAGVWEQMAPEEEQLMGSRAAAANEAEAATRHLRPRGPLVDVAAIGVHPSHWRRGLATRLLRPVLDLAHELGAPAYLETSSTANVALYERNGFEVIGEATVPGGGPRVWAMRT
jgi:GNAT superfamily N-acetyltransferase